MIAIAPRTIIEMMTTHAIGTFCSSSDLKLGVGEP